MRAKQVVVTGGAGYIGSHTIIELLKNNYSVTSIDNFSRSSAVVYDRINLVAAKQFERRIVDLCDLSELRMAFREIGPGASIIHFAAYKSVPESINYPGLYYKNNIISLINLLDVARESGVANIVFSSSCSVYGDVALIPVNEDTPLARPKSPYASTKVMGEKILRDVGGASGINTIILRYFNPVGAHRTGMIGEMPIQTPDNLVPVITQTAIGKRQSMTVFGGDLPTRDGSCVRDYVHVMDIARAHVLALDYLINNQDVHEIINLGRGQGVTVFEAIKAFETVTGKSLNYNIGPARAGDVVEIFSDASRARKILGWEAEYGVQEMLESAWQWQLELARAGG